MTPCTAAYLLCLIECPVALLSRQGNSIRLILKSSALRQPVCDNAGLCRNSDLIGGQAPLHTQHHLGKLGNAVLHRGHVQHAERGFCPGLGGFSPLTAAGPHQQPQLNLQAGQRAASATVLASQPVNDLDWMPEAGLALLNPCGNEAEGSLDRDAVTAKA